MTEAMKKDLEDIAKAYAKRIGATLLYVNTDCGKFGVELKSGDFKNIYFTDLEDLLK
jgi:hypothetical protein